MWILIAVLVVFIRNLKAESVLPICCWPKGSKLSGRSATSASGPVLCRWYFPQPGWNGYTAMIRSSAPRLWEQGALREGEVDIKVREAVRDVFYPLCPMCFIVGGNQQLL
jgi:hypothetical protein